MESVLYRTEPDVQVLVHAQRPDGEAKGEIILVHGLEGSSASGYMPSMAYAALERGYATHRFNLRGCGGTERSRRHQLPCRPDLRRALRDFASASG